MTLSKINQKQIFFNLINQRLLGMEEGDTRIWNITFVNYLGETNSRRRLFFSIDLGKRNRVN